MSECDDSADKTALPRERAQPSQPVQRGKDQDPAAQSGPLFEIAGESKRMNRQEAGAEKRTPALDHARFTAGIIGLYEAILSEPIPEKMLRLIEEIGKQERKS